MCNYKDIETLTYVRSWTDMAPTRSQHTATHYFYLASQYQDTKWEVLSGAKG